MKLIELLATEDTFDSNKLCLTQADIARTQLVTSVHRSGHIQQVTESDDQTFCGLIEACVSPAFLPTVNVKTCTSVLLNFKQSRVDERVTCHGEVQCIGSRIQTCCLEVENIATSIP
jgi:hypothetical protein